MELIRELTQINEAVTDAKVKAAFAKADKADLAVEREQNKSGYGRSNEKVRELKVKAQRLRSAARDLEYELKKSKKLNEADEGTLSIYLDIFDKEEFKGTKAEYPNVKFGALRTQGNDPAWSAKATGSKDDLKKLVSSIGMSKKEAKEMYPELF